MSEELSVNLSRTVSEEVSGTVSGAVSKEMIDHRWASPFSQFAQQIISVCFFFNKQTDKQQTLVCTMGKW
jgi:hypothetical protein